MEFVPEALDELEVSTDALASRTKREAFSEDERRIAGVSSLHYIHNTYYIGHKVLKLNIVELF